MLDPQDCHDFILGLPLRPRWKDAPFHPWFAWRPILVDGRPVWLRWVERRKRRAHRISFTPFGAFYPHCVDYRWAATTKPALPVAR